MSVGYLYPSLFGFLALLLDIGAIVGVISVHARSRHGSLARRFERSVRVVGAASTVVLAVSIAVLYSTVPTTHLHQEAAMSLAVLSAGLLGTLEAHSPSGRVLTSMGVEPGEVQTITDRDGVAASSGTMGRVDLSCGRLTIWAGDIQPSGPAPPASPGSPDDCAP